VIALVALLLIVLGNVFTSSNNETSNDSIIDNLETDQAKETISKEPSSDLIVSELEESYEQDLKEMLDNIQGVSDVEVMVNLDSTNVKVYEKNLIKGQQVTDESDKNGGIRKVEDQTEETQVVLVRQGDQEVPLLVQTEKPKVRGVFVVAKGVDHAAVKMWVIEAVAKVLDVPTHKVSVLPKN
jgi:stage III sporulation protein AG